MADVEDILAHFGVKGMHWGIRKNRTPSEKKQPKAILTHKFKSGDSVSIYEQPPSAVARLISRMSPKYADGVDKFKTFAFKDKDGKNVGNGSFDRTSKDELYLNWISVKPKYRGKGYASAAMKGVIKYAQNEGIKKLTLEVPGNAPDARHIYEKLGFKADGTMLGEKGDIWGGLFPMQMTVPSVKHAEFDETQWEQDFADEFAALLINTFGGGEVGHTIDVDDVLAHFGVKGMKWGHRKAQVPASKDAQASLDIRAKAKKGKPRALTNAELRMAIDRMNLEQQFKRLAVNERPPVQRWVASTLLEIGKREVQTAAAKKVGAIVAKKFATGGLA
jgi:RimJ/RimL family protein N-acetyltransferase